MLSLLLLCCLSTFHLSAADKASNQKKLVLPANIAKAIAWHQGMSYGPTYSQEKSDKGIVHAFCLNAHHQIGVVKLNNNSLTFSFCDKVRFEIPDIAKYPQRYFIYRSSYDQQAEQQIEKTHAQCKNIQQSSSAKSALKRYKRIIKKEQEKLGSYTKDIAPYASAYLIDLEKWAEIHTEST
ncbi:MAG: hypothetical protein WD055_02060 [Candidatus Dependentiae bacterium]